MYHLKINRIFTIKENNILIKNDVEKLITGKLGVMNVYHVNGKIYSTKRSCKGCYIVVDGVRKYIVRDETY